MVGGNGALAQARRPLLYLTRGSIPREGAGATELLLGLLYGLFHFVEDLPRTGLYFGFRCRVRQLLKCPEGGDLLVGEVDTVRVTLVVPWLGM